MPFRIPKVNMSHEEFERFRNNFLKSANQISANKRIEYTNKSDDVLANFIDVGKRLDITPLKAVMVYMNKGFDAMNTHAKTGNQYSDENFIERCYDLCNYSILAAAIYTTTHTEHTNENNTKPNRDGISLSVRHDQNGPKPTKWNELQRDSQT